MKSMLRAAMNLLSKKRSFAQLPDKSHAKETTTPTQKRGRGRLMKKKVYTSLRRFGYSFIFIILSLDASRAYRTPFDQAHTLHKRNIVRASMPTFSWYLFTREKKKQETNTRTTRNCQKWNTEKREKKKQIWIKTARVLECRCLCAKRDRMFKLFVFVFVHAFFYLPSSFHFSASRFTPIVSNFFFCKNSIRFDIFRLNSVRCCFNLIRVYVVRCAMDFIDLFGDRCTLRSTWKVRYGI